MHLQSIEVVADRTKESRCDEGFLKLSRLVVRNVYRNGSTSAPYACDVVSRPDPDAVAVVLYRRIPGGRVEVVLKEGPRPPVYLRHRKTLVKPDPAPYLTLVELVAGVLEREDAGVGGIQRRASIECREEAGYSIDPGKFRSLGEATFASPGTSDEKVYFCSVETPEETPQGILGDGSTMEEGTRTMTLELGEAIRMCREGRIADMKTEVGLVRLAEQVGYRFGPDGWKPS